MRRVSRIQVFITFFKHTLTDIKYNDTLEIKTQLNPNSSNFGAYHTDSEPNVTTLSLETLKTNFETRGNNIFYNKFIINNCIAKCSLRIIIIIIHDEYCQQMLKIERFSGESAYYTTHNEKFITGRVDYPLLAALTV